VAQTGEPLLLYGKVEDSRFKLLVERDEPIKSALCVPLKVREKIIGVLMVRKPPFTSKFTDEHLEFLTTIADGASIAIENARLYRQEQARVAEMTRLNETLSYQKMKLEAIVSIVTHDLKSPLTSIQGFLELLLTRRIPEEQAVSYLTIMQEESHRLLRLINNLLDLSKLEKGEWKPNLRCVDLTRLVKAVLASLPPHDEKIKIVFSPEVGLPNVLADEDLIVQVLHNLLSNAAKYSPDGGTIDIRTKRDGKRAEVQVEDQGIGIPGEKLPQLFSRYFRVGAKEAAGIPGTGLGLANVKYIVEAHGGELQVKSREGKGSLFSFWLPFAPS